MDFVKARANMVDSQVRTDDVTDPFLLAALKDVPRERFVPEAKRSVAYMGVPIEVAPGRYLLDARSFAKLANLAEITRSDRILDVGPATGYSTVILGRLGKSVIAVESDSGLAAQANELTGEFLGLADSCKTGPLAHGHTAGGPYDVIFLNGAVSAPPEALLEQLALGGRLVGVVTDRGVGKAHIFIKSPAGFSARIAFDATVPPLPGFAAVPQFVF